MSEKKLRVWLFLILGLWIVIGVLSFIARRAI